MELESRYAIEGSRIFIVRNMTRVNPTLEEESKRSLLDFLVGCIFDGKRGVKFHERKRRDRESKGEQLLMNRQERIAEEMKEKNNDSGFERMKHGLAVPEKQIHALTMESEMRNETLHQKKETSEKIQRDNDEKRHIFEFEMMMKEKLFDQEMIMKEKNFQQDMMMKEKHFEQEMTMKEIEQNILEEEHSKNRHLHKLEISREKMETEHKKEIMLLRDREIKIKIELANMEKEHMKEIMHLRDLEIKPKIAIVEMEKEHKEKEIDLLEENAEAAREAAREAAAKEEITNETIRKYKEQQEKLKCEMLEDEKSIRKEILALEKKAARDINS